MSRPVAIRILSDVVWPWCWIAKRHLEKAAIQSKVPILVRWEPYMLNPSTPPEGIPIRKYIADKYGPQMAAMSKC